MEVKCANRILKYFFRILEIIRKIPSKQRFIEEKKNK